MVFGGARRPDAEEDIVPWVFGSYSLRLRLRTPAELNELNLARDELPACGRVPNGSGAKEHS
jgi:hypothetical protein